ncbi:MAG TPA: WD40 repeat domain-containing protein [Candidatus Dormibacteraeota bacterium]
MPHLHTALALTLALSAGPPAALRLDAFGDPLPPGALARLGTARLRAGVATGALYSADGKILVTADGARVVSLWDADGKEVRRFRVPYGHPQPLALSPGARLLALSSYGESFSVWDVAAGKEVRQFFEDGQRFPNCVAFSPDGRVLATAGEPPATDSPEAPVSLWDVARGELLRHLHGHRGSVRCVAFSPDGKTLASGGSDLAVRLWEVASGKERRVFQGSRGNVMTAAFSPNGQLLASGGMADPTVLLWDVTGLGTGGRRPAARLRPDEAETLWADLASDNAAQAYHAVWALGLSPAQAVPLLRDRLKPLPPVDPNRLTRLVADLDSDRFAVREKAMQELEKFGDLALPALRKVLAGRPSVEVQRRVEELLERFGSWVTSGERLRGLRGVEVLEHADTPEARAALEKFARQAPESDVGREARAAMERLARRPAATP